MPRVERPSMADYGVPGDPALRLSRKANRDLFNEGITIPKLSVRVAKN